MIDKVFFCRTNDGMPVELFTLKNQSGMQFSVINQGACLVSLLVPDRLAEPREVMLKYPVPEDYLENNAYLGVIVGRYANRIAKSEFMLDGTQYQLDQNRPEFTIHGGSDGFSKRLWHSSIEDDSLVLELESPDGDQGFPGKLNVKVRYSLREDNSLIIDYLAETDRKTVVNLTNHAYFNLSACGNLDEHEFFINAAQYTECDKNNLPTGAIFALDKSCLDLRVPANIADLLRECPGELTATKGFDHNYILTADCATLQIPAAAAKSTASGIVMEMFTSEPAVQFYTGNGLPEIHSGFCFEAQHFPDSPNHANFPSTVLCPGEVYRQTTVYRFRVE
ncbi:MAG: galactose mutarotase [Victivallaceae bacterium]|nr:galactose mutarotase [Victivallaceae bacterium]MDD3704327.1 galactose mutarotase [Victivallaceae bacterium]MDD4317518.1 galactose mutarotase [Victivallaceae bacterium]NLK82500.1 galactose mutarotase [Lentisphaerota bacterium]